MSVRAAPPSAPPPAARRRVSEPFLLLVLCLMVAVLGYIRFVGMGGTLEPDAPEFSFRNPLLAAQPGERVLFYAREQPQQVSCLVVRPEGVVTRPARGPEHLGILGDLRRERPYVATEYKALERGDLACGPSSVPAQAVLYPLNDLGMPQGTQVRMHSIQPLRVRWRDRELVVYEVVFERYGMLPGTWRTYLSEDAPALGLVKRTALHPNRGAEEVHFQELVEAAAAGGP